MPPTRAPRPPPPPAGAARPDTKVDTGTATIGDANDVPVTPIALRRSRRPKMGSRPASPIGPPGAECRSKKMTTDKGLQAIESEARARVEEAAEFSLSSSWPDSEDVATQVTTI